MINLSEIRNAKDEELFDKLNVILQNASTNAIPSIDLENRINKECLPPAINALRIKKNLALVQMGAGFE